MLWIPCYFPNYFQLPLIKTLTPKLSLYHWKYSILLTKVKVKVLSNDISVSVAILGVFNKTGIICFHNLKAENSRGKLILKARMRFRKKYFLWMKQRSVSFPKHEIFLTTNLYQHYNDHFPPLYVIPSSKSSPQQTFSS